MGILNKTKCYTIGHMQYISGEGWREYLDYELTKLGIGVWTPYNKPMIGETKEDDKARADMLDMVKKGEYDRVSARMKTIRGEDLRLCDLCDFGVAHLYPEIASWGSGEEISWMARCKKPTFISIEGGKKRCPLWLFGMFPHKYIYDSVEDIIRTIKKIDSGNIPIDSDRWKLLKEEYR